MRRLDFEFDFNVIAWNFLCSTHKANPCYKMSFIGGVLHNQNERCQLYMVPRSCKTLSRARGITESVEIWDTFNIITMLVRVYSGTSLHWYEFTLVIVDFLWYEFAMVRVDYNTF